MSIMGFIGAGKMGGAILSSFLDKGLVERKDVLVCEATAERAAAARERFGVNVATSPEVLAGACDVIFLAVKPQDLDGVLERIAPDLKSSQLLVSIAAGKKLARIRELAGPKARLARVMPNLPVLVGKGMVVYTMDEPARPADRKIVAKLLGACGKAVELAEEHFDAVTALSGSGPAFFAYVMRQMALAGEKLGLPADAAALLSNETMLGTAAYLAGTGQDPESFIRAVCSPKGTTEAGMKELAASDVAEILGKTLSAAATRSAELSNL